MNSSEPGAVGLSLPSIVATHDNCLNTVRHHHLPLLNSVRMTVELARQRIVVTGGTGFLGRALCAGLRQRGCDTLAVPTHLEYDLLDAQAVERLFANFRPQVIFHLAAQVGGIGANQREPGRFFYENLQMGLNLIEASRRHGIEKFLQVGTVCAYPKFTPVPFREDDLWNGYPEETNAPYGIAKKALLVMLQSYRQQYGLNGIFVLPVNLFGPGDNYDPATSHVIPALIRKCVEAQRSGAPEIVVWGTGSASREFLYVHDCAEGLIRAAAEYSSPDPVNLGSGQEISIRELVALIVKLTGYQGQVTWDTTRPDGQPRRSLDTSRARQAFGFQAQTSLLDGLRITIQDYLTNQ
ncbi:MAG: NAD-dependent dehydratase [Planctomycetaceae bacterium]|nr:NAD-dependent dehydratase [Planctomycetaceae bacterium]